MKQFKRTLLRTILDILYTAFLPLLPAILVYGFQKLTLDSVLLWPSIVVFVVFAIIVFLFTFYKNSTHFEVDEREVRHYHFGKLVNTFALSEYSFHSESRITSAGTASLKLCVQKDGEKKRTNINCLGLGDKQVKEMIQLIERDQAKLQEVYEDKLETSNIIEPQIETSTEDIKEVTTHDNE